MSRPRIVPATIPTTLAIDADIEVLAEQIRAVRELGRSADADHERIYDLSIRWGAALAGRLRRLQHLSAQGRLTEPDQRTFAALCEELRDVADTAVRLGLSRPDV